MTILDPAVEAPPRAEGDPTPQTRNNLTTWGTGDYLDMYTTRVLRPVEVKLLVRYQRELEGRVLEAGCGGGRLLAFLAAVSGELTGIDLSEGMVAYCRATVPDATVLVGDLTALEECVDGPFDVIVAGDNIIDIFGDAERRRVLRSIRELLTPEGLLIFSSHDLDWVERNPGPRDFEVKTQSVIRRLWERSPADVGRAVARRRRVAANRRRLRPLEERHEDYAILNDFAHDYGLLHYYIRPAAQERQLAEVGFELLERLDENGHPVGPTGNSASDSVHYVARQV